MPHSLSAAELQGTHLVPSSVPFLCSALVPQSPASPMLSPLTPFSFLPYCLSSLPSLFFLSPLILPFLIPFYFSSPSIFSHFLPHSFFFLLPLSSSFIEESSTTSHLILAGGPNFFSLSVQFFFWAKHPHPDSECLDARVMFRSRSRRRGC